MTISEIHPGQTIAPNVSRDEKTRLVTSEQEIANAELVSGNDDSSFLVTSPYTEKEHRLDLRSVGIENALLARALVHMKSVRPDYATAAYTETFNWSDVMGELRGLLSETGHKWKETSFYIVAFRSQIPPSTVYAELGQLDKAAHAEAVASGGFLK